MSAPPTASADTRAALARVDRRWCQLQCDEPLDDDRLTHLAAGIDALISRAGDDEVTHLRAALAIADQRREDLRAQLGKQLEVQERRAERAEHQRNTWKGEYDRVVDDKLVELTDALEERDAARAALEDVGTELARLRHTRASAQAAEVTAAIAEAPAPSGRRHRHAWEVQRGLTYMPLPCACGLPWPRNRPPIGGV